MAIGDLDRLVDGWHPNPHEILGPHLFKGEVTVRVLRPMAESVTVVTENYSIHLDHEFRGVWCGVISMPEAPNYSIEVQYGDKIVGVIRP